MSDSPTASFGSYLRDTRVRRGLTLQEISDSTKISMTVLRALEDDRHDDVPGGIFARAFVKSYAVELGLEPSATVDQFLKASEKGRLSARPHTFDPEFGLARGSPALSSQLVLGFLAAGVAIVLAFGIVSYRSDDVPDAGAAQPTAAERSEATVMSTGPTVELPGRATGSLMLAVHPTGPCWVSLTVDGERVFSRVLQPGEREVHVAEVEFGIVVGDTTTFDFSINDRHGQLPEELGQTTVTINRTNYREFLAPGP